MSRSRPDSSRQASSLDGAHAPLARPITDPRPAAPPAVLPATIHGERVPVGVPVFISNVSFDSSRLYVRLAPAQEIALPLHRLPVLAAASAAHRRSWQIVDHGTAVSWPSLHLTITLAHLRQAVHDPSCACECLTLLEATR